MVEIIKTQNQKQHELAMLLAEEFLRAADKVRLDATNTLLCLETFLGMLIAVLVVEGGEVQVMKAMHDGVLKRVLSTRGAIQ